jgi:hypothetical protein
MAYYRKIYYDNQTGSVIRMEAKPNADFIKTTFDEDYQSIKDLNNRAVNTIGLLELYNDQYDQDFAVCGLNVKVDLVTKELRFMHPTDNGDTTPEKPFVDQITDLKELLDQSRVAINFLLMGGM